MSAGTPEIESCAEVRIPGFAHAHITPINGAPSSAHNAAHSDGESLQAVARQRLQKIAERTLPRTLERTALSNTPAHYPPKTPPDVRPDVRLNERLQKLAAEACASLSGYITTSQLIGKLAPEDVNDLQAMPTDSAVRFLRSFATAVVWTDMRQQGIAPPGWNKAATCDLCGPVYLWASVRVAGCPWCWNRRHNIKIPRPPLPGSPSGKL